MRAEYLLFDLVILGIPLALSRWPAADFRPRFVPAFLACVIVGAPYLVWDATVAGEHWEFNHRHVLGVELLGLPIEEILFFVSVPFACLYTWIILLRGDDAPSRPGLAWTYPLVLATLPVGGWALSLGKGYTGLMLLALGACAALDLLLRTRLLLRPRFWGLLASVLAFTLVFNGYLTARPVVLYAEQYQLGIRVITIPIEDFGYGLGLVWANVIVFDRLTSPESPFLGPWIERRLGGYRQRVGAVDEARPLRPQASLRVAVVGSGIAGLTAATWLARRGIEVVLLERKDQLGGKCRSFPVELADGTIAAGEHGFHAFFRHYYNLSRLLAERGIDRSLRSVGDYLILTRDGRRHSFRGVATTPGVNLVSLAWHGLYRLGPVVFGKAGPAMECFLRYDRDETFAALDGVSFDAWARDARLPRGLEIVFTSFARAFFADRDRISMAELVKSFHFYYLSHDHGLVYDYLDDDYERALIEPLRAGLLADGATIRTGHAVASLALQDGKIRIGDETFDDVVLATDPNGARTIVAASPSIALADPALAASIAGLKSGQRYAVLRLWLGGDVELPWPVFVVTERPTALDAIALIHRAEATSAAWAQRTGGAVVELHCYAVPDELTDEEIRSALLADLHHYAPALRELPILGEDLQIGRDMTAFHVGAWRDRPETTTAIPGLCLAGDWVKLPIPAMLMEAACTAGLLAANAIMRRHGLREEPVFSVPPRGLLA
jgi:isorenieratene synthase